MPPRRCLVASSWKLLYPFISGVILFLFFLRESHPLQRDLAESSRETSGSGCGERETRSGGALTPLNGPPTTSYKENLRSSTNYITSWGSSAGWTNDVMSFMNLIYLGLITDRVPILPHHTSVHLPPDSPPLLFSEAFDLPRLRQAIERPILEWKDVKLSNSSTVDDIGCWAVWPTVDKSAKQPRGSVVLDRLKLDVAYMQTPWWVKMWPVLHDLHVTFWALAALDQSTTRAQVLADAPQKYHSNLHKLLLLPDEQLLCYDYLYYAVAHWPYEIEMDNSPAWKYVGQHMHWTNAMERLADVYIQQMFGLDDADSIPPFISVHVRHGDFKAYCPAHLPPDECFASLPEIARNVDDVKAEIFNRKGIEVKHVIITSDERNQAWWDQVAELGWYMTDHVKLQTAKDYGVWYPVLVDSVILSRGVGIVGTWRSTMSILAARRIKSWRDGSVRYVKWVGAQE